MRKFFVLALLSFILCAGGAFGQKGYVYVEPEAKNVVFLEGETTTLATSALIWEGSQKPVLMKGDRWTAISGDPENIGVEFYPETGRIEISALSPSAGVTEVRFVLDGEKMPNQSPIMVSVVERQPRFENIDLKVAYSQNRRFIQAGQRFIVTALLGEDDTQIAEREFFGHVVDPDGQKNAFSVKANLGENGFTIFDLEMRGYKEGRYLIHVATLINGAEVGTTIDAFFESFDGTGDYAGPVLRGVEMGVYDEHPILYFQGRFPYEQTGEVLLRIGRQTIPSFVSFANNYSMGIPIRGLKAGAYDVSVFFPSSGVTVSLQEGVRVVSNLR